MKNITLILAVGLVLFAFAYLFILGDTNKAFLMAILASNVFVLIKLDKSDPKTLMQTLVPAICPRCAAGQELVISASLIDGAQGDYAHREVQDGWLHDCRAHAIHVLLETSAEQIQSDD